MKPALQLNLGQQLTMTPQLQQAIKLLQLSTLDLQQEIQQVIDNNPMLEIAEDDNEDSAAADGMSLTPLSTTTAENDADSNWDHNDAPDNLSVDTNWDDIYPTASSTTPSNNQSLDDDYDIFANKTVTESLQDHLLWQLNLTPMSDQDRIMAMALIDAIDDDGYLTASLDDILIGLHQDEDTDVDSDELLAVLHRLQHFDPIGVGARNLQECLQIQLKQLAPDTPHLPHAKQIIDHYIQLLGSRDYTQLMRKLQLKESELREVMRLIQTLNPKPGATITPNEAEYVVPDVFVKKINGRWRVDLNSDATPKLRVNPYYAAMVKRADSSADNAYLRNNLQEARWFIKSVQSRNETLLKVASQIVEHQRGFFEYGAEAMKPLVLHEIAQVLELHESTISRVTTQKYMHTPHGIFELKYFFSSHVSTDTGGECSSTAIRAIIKKLVAAENIKKPLSDSKIADVLTEQGIQVARRTIAKYRESLGIPPSNERKRLM